MKKTVLLHFYNESYLLPFWLNHHRERFDHGILLNNGSTDNSIEIINDLVPNWTMINNTSAFDAENLENIFYDLDLNIKGIRIILTATEFIMGDLQIAENSEVVVPSVDLVSLPGEFPFDEDKPFHEQIKVGIDYKSKWPGRSRRGRLLTTVPRRHIPGRHFDGNVLQPALIYRVGNCLVNENMISRRLQIQKTISKSDINKGFGNEHTDFGRGLTREKLLAQVNFDLDFRSDLSTRIESVLFREWIAKRENSILLPSKQANQLRVLLEDFDSLMANNDLMESKVTMKEEHKPKSKYLSNLLKKFLIIFKK
jgi:hypothetical protein